jgi:hypothetical protein
MYQTLDNQDLMWILRVLPKPILALMKEEKANIMLAGGFIRSCVLGEAPSDVDLFCPNKEVCETYANKLKERPGVSVYSTDNAHTLKGFRFAVQFIHRWTYDNPEQILSSFDFTIACASVWFDGENWKSLVHPRFYQDLAAKRLVYTSPDRNEDAGGSLLRVLKFYQRGFRIPLGSFGAVIARLVNAVDLNGIEVLDTGGTRVGSTTEQRWATILTGLLREVDPLIDPEHISHLPSISGSEEESNDLSLVQ